jgi:hypothetical protein
MTGYSKTPLIRKLGLPDSGRAVFLDAPPGYPAAIGAMPGGLRIGSRLSPELDYIHIFVASRARLRALVPRAVRALSKNGALWISWPKLASGLAADLRESDVREAGLGSGLVDVKICAVDEVWSGLKFVYRLRDR